MVFDCLWVFFEWSDADAGELSVSAERAKMAAQPIEVRVIFLVFSRPLAFVTGSFAIDELEGGVPRISAP
jgi:hypothetical protein